MTTNELITRLRTQSTEIGDRAELEELMRDAADRLAALTTPQEGDAPKALAERDAALAAIERVRAIDQVRAGADWANSRFVGDRDKRISAHSFRAGLHHAVAALDGAPEPEWEYRYAEKLGDTEYTYGPEHDDRGWFATAEEASAARIEGTDYVVRRRPAGPVEPLPVGGETDGQLHKV